MLNELPGRLLGALGYLGGEDFKGYEDLMAYCTRNWTNYILLRDCVILCATTLAVLLVIGGVEKKTWTSCGG